MISMTKAGFAVAHHLSTRIFTFRPHPQWRSTRRPLSLVFPLIHPHFRRHGCENDFFRTEGLPKDSSLSFGSPGTVILLRGITGPFALVGYYELSLHFPISSCPSGQALVIFVSSVLFCGPSIDRDGMLDLWADRRNDKYPLCAVE